jgi:Holliday junction resolvase-like predicted endonuclease
VSCCQGKGRVRKRLLKLFESACVPGLESHERGARFEKFVAGFFSPPFRLVSRNLRTENGELDLVLENICTDPFWMEHGADVFVECKNWSANVPVKEVGAFLSRVSQGRVKLAFIVSVSGFTENAQRTLRNYAANGAAALVVPLTGESIRRALFSGVNLEEFLKEEIRRLKFRRMD